MSWSRRAIALAFLICAAAYALIGVATAQSSTSTTRNKLKVGLSPRKINFGKQPAGTTSNPRTVTLTNKGNVDLAAPVVSVNGTGFSLDTNGCMSTIPPAGTCPVSVTFTPPTKGKFKHGWLTFTDAAAKSPQKVKLIGVGLPPSPTATTTATPTATSTASSTATATKTATPTSSATPTATATATQTATHTATTTATATATTTATPTATPSPGVNVVFVTSVTYDGRINGNTGLDGADTACQTLANNAGLPMGTYKAWLSTSTVTAVSRLGAARAFVRVDGAPIADQISDLTSGKILNPIALDETGSDARFPGNSDVWTGSTNTGTLGGFGACVDWTSALLADNGETGHFDGGPTQ
ncbi:MAG: choice-of-anchor D domain-containing protein [Candidatus Binatus sp.]